MHLLRFLALKQKERLFQEKIIRMGMPKAHGLMRIVFGDSPFYFLGLLYDTTFYI